MRVGFTGSRTFARPEQARQVVCRLLDRLSNHSDAVVVVGDCPCGVDAWVAREAQIRGLPVDVYIADWSRHGRAAGPIRNGEIVANCDTVCAIWNGTSRGTEDCMRQADRAGKIGFVWEEER